MGKQYNLVDFGEDAAAARAVFCLKILNAFIRATELDASVTTERRTT